MPPIGSMPGSSLSRSTISYCETEERLPLGPERNLEVSARLSYAAGVSHVRSDHELERIIPTQGLSLLNFLIAPSWVLPRRLLVREVGTIAGFIILRSITSVDSNLHNDPASHLLMHPPRRELIIHHIGHPLTLHRTDRDKTPHISF